MKTVIEKAQYVTMLNNVNALAKYGFQELMNKFGFPGTNWKYDGSRSIVFKNIVSGMDSPINKQVLVKGGEQQWSMADATKTITREREYYDLSDEIYERTADVDGYKVMASYEANGRPLTVTRGIAADLYKAAEDDESGLGVINGSLNMTPDEAWGKFYDMKAALEDNSNYDSSAILYCIPAFLRKLVDGDINKRVIQNGSDVISRQIAEIDGVKIRTLNPKNMKTKYDETADGMGLVAAEDAKQIIALMVAEDAVAVPFIIESVYVDAPHAGSKGKWEISNRFAFNAIVNPFFGLGTVALIDNASEVNP